MDLTGAKVLLVDDQRENLDLLVDILKPERYDIRVALNGAVALDLVRRFAPDLILLDVMMPQMDGLEVCRQLQANPALRDTPVIFLTGRTELADVVAGFEAGGVDYIPKPFREQELRMRVATQLRLRLSLQELAQKNQILETEIAHREALSEERDQLAGRISLISDEEARHWGIDGFVGQSQTLGKILGEIKQLRQVDTTSVLITGESGTGKELVARALHFGSARAQGPFVPVNCSAISRELADSLLFGHVKGAFTGADRDRVGYFALAEGGTLFLDEIGDMPLELQAKLLRVLEQRAVLPVGGNREKAVDVRVLAATHADLEAQVREGRFRQDLFFRLAGFPVQVPPLRERREDIPLLAQHFVEMFAIEMGVTPPSITPDSLALLTDYAYPGNVRELKNGIERALIESGGKDIQKQHLHLSADVATPTASSSTPSFDDLPLNLERAEWTLMQRALAQTKGNVAKAARLLGINRTKIYRRMAAEGEEDLS
ncbi:MAG: sigma-54-dependent Fis family transcriptional regulator [Gemmatimonadetes bacterium]|jgi:DNA-binding NtrC family response regulator|nr:sigma-54-dependent Fis family transcriptional regulator [Gemmatimonadota bacterium]